MGLDAVELVMAIEEEFGVEISDESATKMRTVGDLVDFVAANTSQAMESGSRRCEWVDKQFVEVTGRTISDLPPEMRVIDVLDGGRKARQWEKLSSVLPEVERPDWARLCIPIGLLILGGMVIGAFAVASGSRLDWVFWVSLLAVLPYLILALLSLLSAKIPNEELTLGEVLLRGEPDRHREFIGERVKLIVADQLCVPLSIVRDESSFIEDLGMQ